VAPPRTFTPPPPARPEAVLPPEDDAPRWPVWMGPVALVAAIIATTVVGAIAIPIIHGVGANTDDPNKGGVAIGLTYLQDVVFIATVLVFARVGALRRPRARDLGIRVPAAKVTARWVVIVIVIYLIFSAVFSAVVKPDNDNLFHSLGVHRSQTGTVAALAVLVCVLAPIAEELLFRGFMFATLVPWRGPWVAAAIVGLLFGAIHAFGTPALLLVQLAVLGFLFSVVRWKTGSILPTIGLHAINNSLAFGSLLHWGWQFAPLVLGAPSLALALVAPFARSDWKSRRSLA
jgi:CAAX protease family protein